MPTSNDQHGTIRQIEIVQEQCYCPVEVVSVPGAGHAPQREQVGLDAIADFATRILRSHHEGPG